MKAAILVKSKSPLEIKNISLPSNLSFGQVLVNIKYSGIRTIKRGDEKRIISWTLSNTRSNPLCLAASSTPQRPSSFRECTSSGSTSSRTTSTRPT